MSLSPGTRLGPYEILSPLGAGGMGEVYRARDTRLDRDVAIKSLPVELAQDPERLARFEREAKVLASLSHTNVAGIHGVEEVEKTRYLVLEFVDGETLAARLARAPMSVDDAVHVCAQVAAAVEAAHEAGIIHRDLKPGNVMIRTDGTTKVLDFGLARSGAAGGTQSDLNLSASPTLTHAGTSAGVILGTAAYMSPEQARGRNVDRRTDIWSFGCVLYECLTGRPLFEGDTVSDLIAKILQTEPEWSSLPAATPPRVRALLARCLVKDPKQRLRDIGEARIVLSETTPEPAGSAARGDASSRGRQWATMAGLVVASVLLTVLALRRLSHAPATPNVALSIMLPKGQRLDGGNENNLLAVAPDGKSVVFTASTGGGNHRLFLRRLDRPDAVELQGTDDAADPFFSPDGEWVAFFANRHLLKTSVRGGSPVELADAGSCRGGAWLDDGSIVYVPTFASPLCQMDGNGGPSHAITTLDSTRSERTHRWPCALPGSKWIVFTVGVTNSPGGYDDATIEAVSTQSGERRVLAHGGCAHYAPGRLVFARNGSLYTMAIDPDNPRSGVAAVPVLDGVLGAKTSGIAFFDIARNGTLVTVPGRESGSEARLVWRDFSGHETMVPGEPRKYVFFDISSDGNSALAQIGPGGGNGDVFLIDLRRGTVNQVTFGGHDGCPAWTPDGRHMVWARSIGSGSNEIVTRSVLGGDSVRVLARSNMPLLCNSVRPDGAAALFSEYGSIDSDVSEVPLEGGAVRTVVHEPRSQSRGVLTRDGRWIAYVTDESGTREVCVRPFGSTGGRFQVSSSGGTVPMWAPDGHALYFVSGNGLIEASLVVRDGAMAVDSTRYLFDLPFISSDGSVQSIDLDPTGKRFLVRAPIGETNELREISVRLDWAASLTTESVAGGQ